MHLAPNMDAFPADLDLAGTLDEGMLQAADMQEAFQARKERRASKFEELYPRRSAIKNMIFSM